MGWLTSGVARLNWGRTGAHDWSPTKLSTDWDRPLLQGSPVSRMTGGSFPSFPVKIETWGCMPVHGAVAVTREQMRECSWQLSTERCTGGGWRNRGHTEVCSGG